MIHHRYTIITDGTDEIEILLTRFERDRESGPVDLEHYAPPPDDPAYDAVVTELSRVDLEYRFDEQSTLDSNRYIDSFPAVFQVEHNRTQLAFEEYRLRRRRGEDVTGAEIGLKYNVAGERWPQMRLGGDEAVVNQSASRRFSKSDLARLPVQYPVAGQTFAGFQLVTRIGEGAFSRVFLARQPDLASRLVVLKVTPLSTDESDRLASMQHSAIIPIYSVHLESELTGICMPFLGATTLADLSVRGERWASLDGPAEELVSTILHRRRSTIQALVSETETRSLETDASVSDHSNDKVQATVLDQPPLDESVVPRMVLDEYAQLGYRNALLELVIGSLKGLAYAHRRGVIHRDLKPANILVADDGSPVLLDFNLAVSNQEPETRVVGGTLPYMSPQQLESLESGAPADARDDVFSVGIILYELLSGHLPFTCPDAGQAFDLDTVVENRKRSPNPIQSRNSGVSTDLASIIDKCMLPDREHRYQDAADLLEDLTRHRDHLPLKFAENRSVGERLTKWVARHPRLASGTTVATVAAAALLVCGALIWQRGQRIASLNVQSRYQLLQDQMPGAIVSLSTPGREVELLSGGLTESSRLMSRWHLNSTDLDSVEWKQLAGVDRLDPQDQQLLTDDLSRLAFLMADAEYSISLQSDREDREHRLRQARHWSRLAGELSAELQPLAMDQQTKLDAGNERSAIPGPTVSNQVNAPMQLRALRADLSSDAGQWRDLIVQQIELQPTNISHWFNLGVANGRLGDPWSALASFDVADHFRPHLITTLLNRGICHLDIGQNQQAFDDFSQCVRMKPRLLVPRFNRAVASYRMGDARSAMQDLDTLVKSGHATTRMILMRAEVHDSLGDSAAAKSDRQNAMTVAPRDANDWVSRGISQLSTSPKAALNDFLTAIRIQPSNVAALKNAAYVYSEQLDQTPMAIEMLSCLIAMRPRSSAAVASRGVLQARLGNQDAALADAITASNLPAGAREFLQIAGIYSLVNAASDQDASDRGALHDKSLRWVAKAIRKDLSIARLAATDDDLASVKSDPRFAQLLRSARVIQSE